MPACGGADRITVVVAIPDLPVCAVREGSRVGAVSFQYVQGGCCFPSSTASGPITGAAMLAGPSGIFRPVQIVGVTDATAVCEFTVTDAVPNGLYLNSTNATVHASTGATDFTPFVNGTATLVQLSTYYLDTTAHELRLRRGLGSTAQDGLVAEHIYDLQIALGYDINTNGAVEDNEWAFLGGLGIATADPFVTRLNAPREVKLSIVQGAPASLRPDVVDSPLRPPGAGRTITAPGIALRVGVAHVAPVNTLLRATP